MTRFVLLQELLTNHEGVAKERPLLLNTDAVSHAEPLGAKYSKVVLRNGPSIRVFGSLNELAEVFDGVATVLV